jgi:tetratricopeptide (TPR) repeat protein
VAIQLGSREEPYAALAQLLQDVQTRRVPHVGLPEQVELARLVPLAFPDVQPSQSSLSAPRLHAALRHWAQRLREAGVHRLVLDDVHHADAASQLAFGSMLTTPEGQAPVLPLLLAHGAGEIEPGLTELLVAAQAQGQLHSVALPRLTQQGVLALLKAMHDEHAETHAVQLLQRTGGNPLFVIELAQHFLEKAQSQAPVAGNLEALLRARLGRCSAEAQQLAAVAAVATKDFSVDLAVAVTARSALTLMPAWFELQECGLFADHGLAHDLVRDAALAALPKAIGRNLHRQVARYLEAQGFMGQRVLTHWLAAEDFDAALPHAVRQLDDATVAGLDTEPKGLELLALMQRLSDTALLANLWLSAEVNGYEDEIVLPSELRRSVGVLVERVSGLAQGVAAQAWLAFERARLMAAVSRRRCETLCAAVPLVGEASAQRAWIELVLAKTEGVLQGSSSRHLKSARAIIAVLPEGARKIRLLAGIDRMHGNAPSEVVNALRSLATAMRAARRRHDWGAVATIAVRVVEVAANRGLALTAWRFCRLLALPTAPVGTSELSLTTAARVDVLVLAAISVGRFGTALVLNERLSEVQDRQICAALAYVRLGQWERAKSLLERIEVDSSSDSIYALGMLLFGRLQLDRHDGVDPLPNIRRVIEIARGHGLSGLRLKLWQWDGLLSQGPQERIVKGTALLEEVRQAHLTVRLPRLLLELAEAHVQVGSAECRVLALEAARELRRGRGSWFDFAPENLVRCARLLQDSDPKVADALMRVAQRLAQQSLDDAPDFARESLVNEVPVNRVLLGAVAKASRSN